MYVPRLPLAVVLGGNGSSNTSVTITALLRLSLGSISIALA